MCGLLGWKDAIVHPGADEDGRAQDIWAFTMGSGGIGSIFLMLIALAPCSITVSALA
jgi:hypothetical protein